MNGVKLFAVQKCADPDALQFEPPTSVEAQGALDAAEKVTGEKLSFAGAKTDLVVRVLEIGDDYRTTATMLFRTPDAG